MIKISSGQFCMIVLKYLAHLLLAVTFCVSLSGVWQIFTIFETTEQLSPLLETGLTARSEKIEEKFPRTSYPNNTSHTAAGGTVRFNRETFQSPFMVTQTERDSSYVNLTADITQAPVTRTFAVIWPCKRSNGSVCFLRSSYPTQSCGWPRCRQVWSWQEAQVLVFQVYRFKNPEDVPRLTRPANQRWVMMTVESPARREGFSMLDLPALKGQFNWTLTYRLDSDIPHPYGQLAKQEISAKNYQKVYQSKQWAAAWFVSHCDTPGQRHVYVQRMQAIIDVHVFGSCGNLSCIGTTHKRDLDKDQCLPLLSKQYFFYLAFENSLCRDYVTEKFFKLFDDVDVIPVVRGGVAYKQFFPPDTFIDAADFQSPEDLARFLVNLAKDEMRYMSMLREKSGYRWVQTRRWFCALCDKMHQKNEVKSYPDLRKWYVDGQCYQPRDL